MAIWSNCEWARERAFSAAIGSAIYRRHFLTGSSLITRERRVIQTCKLAQKILHAILRRMVYSLNEKKRYLKSQHREIGRFLCIFAFFSDFPDFIAAKPGGGAYGIGTKASYFRHQMALSYFSNYSFYLEICIFDFL